MHSLRQMIRDFGPEIDITASERVRRFVAPFQKSLYLWPNPQALNFISLLSLNHPSTLIDIGAGPALRSAMGAHLPLLDGMQTLTFDYPYLVSAFRRVAPNAVIEPLSLGWERRIKEQSITSTIYHLSTILERVPDPLSILSAIRGLAKPTEGVIVTLTGTDALEKPLPGDTYQRWTPAEFTSFARRAGFQIVARSMSKRWSCFLLMHDDLSLPPWGLLLSLILDAGPVQMSITKESSHHSNEVATRHFSLSVGNFHYKIDNDDGMPNFLIGSAEWLNDTMDIKIDDLENLGHLEPIRKIATASFKADLQHEKNEEPLQLIKHSVESRTPLAAMRVSHAEIRALGYPKYYPPVWLHRSLKVCFGDDISVDDYADFLIDLDGAVRSSDVLGVPLPSSRDLQHATNAALLNAENIGNRTIKFLGDLHFTLLNRGYLDYLIQSSVAVTLITSRNIVSGFSRKFNKPDTRQINIPGEMRWMHQGPRRHVPDVYREIIQTLNVRERGELFLIGAGLATKKYCQIVRDRGGIALDIGSVLDLWAGAATRTGFEERTKLYSLLNTDTDQSAIGG